MIPPLRLVVYFSPNYQFGQPQNLAIITDTCQYAQKLSNKFALLDYQENKIL